MTVDPVQRNAWRRLKRNKVAFGGLIVIILFTLMAVFAYFISPDSSPNANRMIVEIGGRKPGFTQQFLKLPKAQFSSAPTKVFFRRLPYSNNCFSEKPTVSNMVPSRVSIGGRTALLLKNILMRGSRNESLILPVSSAAAPRCM